MYEQEQFREIFPICGNFMFSYKSNIGMQSFFYSFYNFSEIFKAWT